MSGIKDVDCAFLKKSTSHWFCTESVTFSKERCQEVLSCGAVMCAVEGNSNFHLKLVSKWLKKSVEIQ